MYPVAGIGAAATLGATDADNAGALEFGPFGIQRHRGIEFTVAGELTRGLRLIGGGSVIDAKLRRTQNGASYGQFGGVRRIGPSLASEKGAAAMLKGERTLAEIAQWVDAENINPSYVSRLLRMTLLAPETVEAILAGTQPAGLTRAKVMLPFPWH